ncbi:MAG TPA: RNA polymerase sigma factor [Steroidobacteraceae bacterium]|jgi:RNA polymerase sigma-70 factor (ECF subfamily)|nr:RNA polymerase sigma factor [Steroidobacteraceae bacterium]
MAHAQAEETRVDWESALVQRARGGDQRAFERLYREHAGRVYGLCLRMTRDAQLAEDCTQDTFINAWRALGKFETRSSLSTWLHRIAVNVTLAKRRKSGPVEPLPEEEEGSAAEWALETPVEVQELESAIGALPEGARDALVLHALYGYSHGEAAEMLGIAEGTCKAQLHRARRLLRERLHIEVN